MQTRARELTVQIHNPTDDPIATQVKRSPYFDFVTCKDFDVDIPTGTTLEYVITGTQMKPAKISARAAG